jgi:hypothetical protein
MRILFSLLLIGLFAGNRCNSQGKSQNQAWASCDAAGGASGKCILVTAETALARKMELTFSIPAENAATTGEPAACKFVSGVIGPATPRSKQPTRLIRKLSEIDALVR